MIDAQLLSSPNGHYEVVLKSKILHLMTTCSIECVTFLIWQQHCSRFQRALWGENEMIDKTEAKPAINSYLCWKSHPTRQRKMKKNPLLANQTPTLHMNSKNMRNHNPCFNNNYTWNMNYSWRLRIVQWELCVKEREHYGSYMLSAFFSSSGWMKNNNHIFKSAVSQAFLLLSVLHIMGCWHGERHRHAVFGWRHGSRDGRTWANVYSSWEWTTPLTLQRI